MTDRGIDADLAEWLLAHDRGLTEADALAFDRWLAAAPAHALAWAEVAPMWDSFDQAADDPDLAAMLDEARQARPARRRRRSGLIAAGVALTAAAVWFVVVPKRPIPDNDHAAEQAYATDRAAATYRLADGTLVTLDAQSSLTFVERGGRRLASLARGRAYLDVRHDRAHPFSIAAGGATITDLGTQFGVSVEADDLAVTLVSGAVTIADPVGGGAPVELAPGQQFTRHGGAPGVVSAVDGQAALAWREGYLEFDRTPLATAIAEMNRYAADPIRIADPALGRILVSGRFRADDPQRFVVMLGYTDPVQLVRDAQGRPTIRRK